MSNCPHCGKSRTLRETDCKAICHTIPRCHCGKAVYENGLCYSHFQANVSAVAAAMGRKGGKVKGASKRRDVDYVELGRLGGKAKGRPPKGSGKPKSRRARRTK